MSTEGREQRFFNYLNEVRDIPFELGKHDCFTFVCIWVDRELDTNYFHRVYHDLNYTAESHALRTIARRGGYELLVQRYCGPPSELNGLGYGRGDIAVYANRYGNHSLGLLGERLVYGPGADGLMAVDIATVTKFWRLECLKQ